MTVAAQILRRILLQYARQHRAGKRIAPPENLDQPAQRERWEEILAVDEALTRLSEFAPQQARIAEMRYFGGLSVEEVADALKISPCAVKRDWVAAKGWLHAALSGIGLG